MAVMKFKLMHGPHVCDDSFKGTCPQCAKVNDLTAAKCACGWAKSAKQDWKLIERSYQAGDPKRDIIETTQDLRLLNGDAPSKKFELLVGDVLPQVAAKRQVVDMGEMTLPQLKDFCEEEELDVDFSKAKDAGEALKLVRAARKLQTV